MTDVTFYMLEEADQQPPAHWLAACDIAARCYRNRQRCVVLCQDKQSAEAFDELLWQQPLDSFVPHNLVGEGPNNGAPIEISWPGSASASRPICVNLGHSLPEQAQRFKHIFDFVPAEESAKQQARQRYKHYRAAGMNMHTAPASSINETYHG